MKPIRIEPADIRITIEFSKTELLMIHDYFDKSIPFVRKVFENSPEMGNTLEMVDKLIKPGIEEILKHPMVEQEDVS